MHTDQINHDPAHTVMNTGTSHLRPAEHGLVGHLRPGQRVRQPAGLRRADQRGRPQPAADLARGMWRSGLPARPLPGRAVPLDGRRRCTTSTTRRASAREQQRRRRSTPSASSIDCATRRRRNPEIDTRIAQYEMAFRMQTSVPELMDISDEPQHVLDLYGVAAAPTARSPTTACWPGGWPSAACASSSSTTAAGTTTTTWSSYMNICCGLCDRPTRRPGARTSSSAACSTTR